jgi:hypothetical protein
MKRGGILLGLALAAALITVWWLARGTIGEEPGAAGAPGPSLVSPGEPLAMNETVRMRWVDEETGEEDVWTVIKRESIPGEWAGPALPDPDAPRAPHVPDESSRTLSAMGMESWKSGRIEEAMDHLAAAIEADPDDSLPRTHYGRLLALAMDYQAALPHLERAAEINSSDPQVWLDLATLYEKTLRLERSWEARRRAEALAGGETIRQGEMGFWVVEGNSILP